MISKVKTIVEKSNGDHGDKSPITQKIILDTNFLIIPKSIGVDILSEFDRLFGQGCYSLYIFDKTVDELNSLLLKYRGKEKLQVTFAKRFLEFLKKEKGLFILESNKKTYLDDTLVSFVKSAFPEIYHVATVDTVLSKRLIDVGAKVINARKMKFLFIR
jgi:rRNA-processing protein FCF1